MIQSFSHGLEFLIALFFGRASGAVCAHNIGWTYEQGVLGAFVFYFLYVGVVVIGISLILRRWPHRLPRKIQVRLRQTPDEHSMAWQYPMVVLAGQLPAAGIWLGIGWAVRDGFKPLRIVPVVLGAGLSYIWYGGVVGSLLSQQPLVGYPCLVALLVGMHFRQWLAAAFVQGVLVVLVVSALLRQRLTKALLEPALNVPRWFSSRQRSYRLQMP